MLNRCFSCSGNSVADLIIQKTLSLLIAYALVSTQDVTNYAKKEGGKSLQAIRYAPRERSNRSYERGEFSLNDISSVKMTETSPKSFLPNAGLEMTLTVGSRPALRKNHRQHRRFLSNVRKKLKDHVNKEADWGPSNKEAAEMFDKYNECLQQKLSSLETEEFPIKPIMAIEGEKIVMECLVW
ncbi:hypothetical protein Btru_073621 [Bulinus truncatus]|nr:hypothetical protein Btru_073621 [Bulinus truncatus]